MKAKVVKEFPGRPDNEAASRVIPVGEILEGELAQVAVDNKWATRISDADAAKAAEKGAKEGGGGKKQKPASDSGSDAGDQDQGK